MQMRFSIRPFCLAIVGVGFSVLPTQAQEYPEKSIRMIVPFAPGGIVDVSARIVADELSKALDQQIVIDSSPGASGMLGLSIVAKAAPDGYTLLFCPGDH
jgi:tripartite-type tricarboxylate transporter receptor subunit TctC